MNLKLKRLVRTGSSEQYALFDLDQVDENEMPLTIGKLDLHYTGEGTYGTILLWDDTSRQLKAVQRRAFLDALLAEIAQPMGVPSEYVVEFFAPSLDDYEVLHNLSGSTDEYLETDTENLMKLDPEPRDGAQGAEAHQRSGRLQDAKRAQ